MVSAQCVLLVNFNIYNLQLFSKFGFEWARRCGVCWKGHFVHQKFRTACMLHDLSSLRGLGCCVMVCTYVCVWVQVMRNNFFVAAGRGFVFELR